VASSGPAPTAPCLGAPELDAGLQVGSHQSGAERQNHLPRPAGHTAEDAAQDMVGFLGCECTLPAHVLLFIHQYPQVLLGRAALNPLIWQGAPGGAEGCVFATCTSPAHEGTCTGSPLETWQLGRKRNIY